MLASGAAALTLLAAACQGTPASPTTTSGSAASNAAPTAGAAAAAPAATGASAGSQQGDKVVIATPPWGVESALPWRGGNQADTPLWNPVMETLTWLNPQTSKVEPYLATYEPSPDSTTWTLHLHQGVQFHDNFGELTSAHVKYVFDRMLKPDAAGGAGPYLRANVDHVDAPDPYTVVVTMKHPDWQLPSNLVTMNILSQKQLEQQGEDAVSTHPAGTGPYKVSDVRQGDTYTFVAATDNHWRWGAPHWKTMVIRRIPDASARMSALRAGEVDLAEVSGDALDQVASTPNLRLIELKDVTHYWVVFTGQTTSDRPDYCPTCPWVGDENDAASMDKALKVRQALDLAVNKQAIVDGLWHGKGTLDPFSYGYYANNDGFDPNWTIPAYDLNQAKQLLAQAGYPNGFEVRVNGAVTPFSLDAPDVMEAVSQDWEKLGLNVTRAMEDMPTFIPKIRARDTKNTFFLYSPAPGDSPTVWWSTAAFPKAGFYFLQDRLYASDIAEAQAEPDASRRATLEHAIGQKLDAGAFGAKLGIKSMTWAVSPKIGDWQPAKQPLATDYATITWSGK